MKTVTHTLLAIALAGSALWSADPPGEKPKEKSPAEVLYEKLLAENTKEADKQYGEYLAALSKANEAIIKKLEIAKADLNNPRKGKLSITERAAAIAEIDAKILEVEKGAVGEAVVAKAAERSGDLLGEGKKVDIEKTFIGVWVIISDKHRGINLTINDNNTATWGNNQLRGEWVIIGGKCSVTWSNGIVYVISQGKNKLSFSEYKNNVIISSGDLEHGVVK